ncbi:MAG: response regulator transcription factor [Microgenomates group bacterium]
MGMKLLVIEDEHRIAAAIKKGLEQEHYIVDLAYDGTEGFDLASSESYDCIILDLMLPGMDGIAICKSLRKEGNHTPVLMLTAKGQLQDKMEGFDSGADDYLTKPFAFEELLARIRAITKRPKTITENILTLADLTLHPENFEVTRGKKLIQLSSKEFALLEYMMRHPNTVLTKDQIIAHVWEYSSDILPNTVEVYMKNLRAKIDVPFSAKKPLITTVRGFGYKIG